MTFDNLGEAKYVTEQMLPRMNPKICGHVDDERSETVSVNLKIAKTRKSKFICLIRFMKKVES